MKRKKIGSWRTIWYNGNWAAMREFLSGAIRPSFLPAVSLIQYILAAFRLKVRSMAMPAMMFTARLSLILVLSSTDRKSSSTTPRAWPSGVVTSQLLGISVMRFSWLMILYTGRPPAVTVISSLEEISFLAAVRMVLPEASLAVIWGETVKSGKLNVLG